MTAASSSGVPNLRVGVDVGGTFTDFVISSSDGSVNYLKVPSSTSDQSVAILAGLEEAGVALDTVTLLTHGTTAAINAVLQRSGAPTGVISSSGFRDVVELRQGARTRLCDPFLRNPGPYVPRAMQAEVREATRADGEIEWPVDVDEVVHTGTGLVGQGAQSLVVTFLNSYANPDNESRAADALRQAFPEVSVTASYEVLPLPDEYSRFTAAVLNGYIKPELERYLGRIGRTLAERGLATPPVLMHSNGGGMTLRAAMHMPIALLESGPAAGIVAAEDLLRETGIAHEAMAFDVGGTTAKATVVTADTAIVTTEYEVGARQDEPGSGWPVALPMRDIVEIGVGGGSIVSVDASGFLTVGPRSAGSEPGPACYGRGGEELTITDCAAIVGVMDNTLGGALRLDLEAARQAAEPLAKMLNLSIEEVARSAFGIMVAKICDLTRELAISRGYDPRDLPLIAYGGAGPMFAGPVMVEQGMGRVIVPRSPGTFSARGLLNAAIERTRTVALGSAPDAGALSAAVEEARDSLEDLLVREDVPDADTANISYSVGVRYSGQRFTLDVPSDIPVDVAAITTEFHHRHHARYGHALPINGVQLVAISATATVARPGFPEKNPAWGAGPAAPQSRTTAWAGQIAVWRRPDLGVDAVIDGPAVIEDYSSTVLVPAQMQATVSESGALILEVVR